MATLNQRVKQLRQEFSLTQKELAKIIGVKSDRSIQYIEIGRSSLNPQQLTVLADYFNVSIDYLVGRSDDRLLTSSNQSPFLEKWVQAGEALSLKQKDLLLQLIEEMKGRSE